MSLYNKVNQPCSSRLPEIKKEEISEEKIGHKRCSKEKLSRGSVSSDETDGKIESENIATIVAKKEKSAQAGKGKKVGNRRKRIRKSDKFISKVSIASDSRY
ncbi:uncharacterized protein OCT59_019084 [Rhizophagus irregularis]|uniref:Uncharacterized protein n=2 Tax=Rhizophagus irregularis TaxID=588596 RepID=U9TR36_RHIID|nr:hypothetical protein GLOIN_2v1777512 [Rhizophagus irregularis DAOM 181602=DAOM 197198]EXX62801.1 hypothetical protein RirG_158370 [Rhizophagus irregularis DAOM 197198w]UZO26871.1 hypothetical protein OCT59_019084 [Rhizophagus irregularis]POG69168.1 hypothetical protein GLOIN_2v1777512 [Rhizophagus irregularis DAOM 181602=DAOM 197198]CAB5212229.1 unnamed protein product [Rhizophagus irregularis]GBC34032.1 hypothetical protein GLOIN_2v1777512 [Rhizophagus irregularis DAOM 181602=DAOM 197198]|eukprot:XP_025176034.1 hypothetical protein GLOIN_2v1777512 [Rhizophagus irregularis DAOM 181602=DAOM 197198]